VARAHVTGAASINRPQKRYLDSLRAQNPERERLFEVFTDQRGL